MVGLGLIGGSLLRRLTTARPPGRDAARYDPVGYDSDPDTRAAAIAAGHAVAPTLAEAVADADLVVLATPLSMLPAVLPVIRAAGPPDAVLTDVASVKVAAFDAIAASGLAGRYVGGHPMAGTERSGFGASDPRLFDGAAWVLCLEPGTDLAAWLSLTALITGMGCHVVPCRATAHDAAVARVSGLPHALAAALAVVGGTDELALALAAGSYRDGTRVAGTRPDLAAALCDANRSAVADALDDVLDRLTTARDGLRAGGSVQPLSAEGYAARQRWQARSDDGERFELDSTDPALRERLAGLGACGGHVESASERSLRCWRPRATVDGSP